MNKANMRGLLAAGVLAACLIGTPALGQIADGNVVAPAGNTDSSRTRDDRTDFGWIGLLGLVGLAGMMRKTRPENLGPARTAASAR